MNRKQKVQLVALFYAPIGLGIPILINLFFPIPFIAFIKYSFYFFSCLFLLMLFLPIGKHRLKQNNLLSFSFFKWLAIIIGIQLGIVALFLAQNSTILSQLNLNLADLLTSPYQNIWVLLPWLVLGFVTLLFAYISSTRDDTKPFSTCMPNRWPTLFASHQIRRIMDLYIEQGARIFIIVNILLLLFKITILLGFNSRIANPFASLIITWAIIIGIKGKRFQALLKNIEAKQLPQGYQLLILSVMIFFALVIGNILIQMLVSFEPQIQTILGQTLVSISNKHAWWFLYTSFWWILAIPFFASLIIKFSKGRTLRQVGFNSLILPIILSAIFWQDNNIATQIISNGYFITICVIVSVVLIGLLLLQRESTPFLWFGFIPTVSFIKSHRTPWMILWIFAIAFLGLALLIGITIFYWAFAIISIGSLMTFYLLIIGLFK